ncbi:MAG: efflux RND transporter periplasmic adaptor subunit [Alphaproteobacteria bacterium]|nr:efflux RND transporter periplasmic adaptor subunit [Alphaproteobacteria bacterium]
MKKAALVLILVALVIAGGAYWWMITGGAMQSAMTAPPQMPPQAVSVIEMAPQKISIMRQLPGRVSPFRQSQVRPQVDGIITERLFEEGADVEKGQQLYQIDDARYKAALNSAIADLKSAEANVKTIEARAKRYEDLVKIKAISQQEYDDAQAQLDQANAAIAVAQAAVDVAQVNLDYTKVYAPISGRISRSFITEGALVTANQDQNLAVITQLDPVYIDMQQSGSDAIHLRARMMGKEAIPVHLLLDEQTGKTYPGEGTLKFSEVTIDETAGSIALRALMPNPDGLLLPGLFVRADLDLGESDAILVPQRAAVRTPEGNLTVWVVDQNNQAQPRPVQVEQAYKDSWIVTDGLSAGDKVIVEGYQKVRPGAPVSPAPWVSAEAAEAAKGIEPAASADSK